MALKPIGSKGLLTLDGVDLVKFVPDVEAIQIATDNAIGNGDSTTLQAAKDDATTKAGTAKTDAIADATTKYGSVDRFMLPPSLGSTENLNNVTTPGRKRQNQSSVAGNTALNYPAGATHGYLDVVSMDGTTGSYVAQEWTETWNSWAATRRRYTGVWSAWERVGASEVAPVAARVSSLESRAASGVQVQSGNAVVYGRYRPDAWAFPNGTVVQWVKPDGSETVFPSSSYLGDRYVGVLGGKAGYTTMLVTKAESNGTVDVSCINPTTNRHVTYRLQGTDNASWLDDFQLIEEIWVGAVVGGVPSKDTLISPRSNMEWAFEIDVAGNKRFVPYHGNETAIDAGGVRGLFRMDGTAVDVASLPVGGTVTGLNGLKLRQSVYGRHPDTGATNWVRVEQVTTISPDGMIQSESTWEALRDVVLGSNYGPMTPVETGIFDTLRVQGGAAYPLDMVSPSVTRYDTINEGRSATSFLMTGPSNAFVAAAFLDPTETFLLNDPRTSTTTPMRIEQRSTGWVKVYPSGFATGAYVTGGTVWKMGAQWRFGETSNPAQYAGATVPSIASTAPVRLDTDGVPYF